MEENEVIKELGEVNVRWAYDTIAEFIVRICADESDEKKFQSTLTELQIQHRKFSRAEIEASLEILADKPFKTDMEKKALFTKFITRIDLYKDGRMNIYTDIFGIKGEMQAIDKSKSEVQLEKRLARH